MSRYKLLALTSAVILILDQATKLYIDATFRLYESVVVIENFFRITYVRNPGAAFGFLSDSAYRIPFFITVAVVASVGILWYLHKLRSDQRWMQFSLALIFSGAIGNLIDRIRIGEVIDFLDVHWYQYHWPAFNVADSAISVGVVVLLLATVVEERRQKQKGR